MRFIVLSITLIILLFSCGKKSKNKDESGKIQQKQLFDKEFVETVLKPTCDSLANIRKSKSIQGNYYIFDTSTWRCDTNKLYHEDAEKILVQVSINEHMIYENAVINSNQSVSWTKGFLEQVITDKYYAFNKLCSTINADKLPSNTLDTGYGTIKQISAANSANSVDFAIRDYKANQEYPWQTEKINITTKKLNSTTPKGFVTYRNIMTIDDNCPENLKKETLTLFVK